MSCYHGSKMFGLQQTKNLTQKVNSPGYKLHQSYSISFNLFRKKKLCCVHLRPKAGTYKKFHVAVVQRRLGNVQKSVMHVQSCCFAK